MPDFLLNSRLFAADYSRCAQDGLRNIEFEV